MAASLLHCLGMDKRVAQDRAADVDLAVALAADKTRLQTIAHTWVVQRACGKLSMVNLSAPAHAGVNAVGVNA